jgi:hypothetical protein
MKYASVELALPIDCVMECSASGPVDGAIAYWIRQPDIASQFSHLSLIDTARILYGYGAWDAEELSDIDTNLERILWIAAGDCRDGDQEPEDGIYWAHMEGHGYERELEALCAELAAL